MGARQAVKGLGESTVAVAALTAGVALLAYLMAMAPDLTWHGASGDGGELITASYTLGVAHPPGYPLYVLIGKLFGMLPVGTIAFRYNLMSAVSAALAAGLVAATVIRLSPRVGDLEASPRLTIGLAAGLIVAFAPLVWSQAIVTEVYALNLALLSAFLLSLAFQGNRSSFLAGLLFGLSLTAHATSLFMFPLALIVIPRTSWPKMFAGILAGLTPLLLVPLLSRSESPVVWGRPDSLSGWWWLITARLYRPNIFALAPAGWLARLKDWTPLFAANILTLAIPLALLRARSGRRSDNNSHRSRPGCEPQSALRGSQAFILLIAVLYMLFAFFYSAHDAEVLLLPAVLALGILLGLRLQRLGLLALLLPAGFLLFNLQTQNLHRDNGVRLAAGQILNGAPPEALLVTSGDQSFAALSYFHHIENQRPDLDLVDANLFQFEWYRQQIAQKIPQARELAGDDLRAFIGRLLETRPVCIVSLLGSEVSHCLNPSS